MDIVVILIAILIFIGVFLYFLIRYLTSDDPWQPVETIPQPLTPLTEQQLEELVDRAVASYRSRFTEPHIALAKKVVKQWPPPLEGAKQIETFISEAFEKIATSALVTGNPFPHQISSPLQTTMRAYMYFGELDPALMYYPDWFQYMQATWPPPKRTYSMPPRPPGMSTDEIMRLYQHDEISSLSGRNLTKHNQVMAYMKRVDKVMHLQSLQDAKLIDQNKFTRTQVLTEIARTHPTVQTHPFFQEGRAAAFHIHEEVCNTPVYLPWLPDKRFEHTQIVGGSGAGKTTLLAHLILHDLKQPEPPCIILIDPKNLVIPKLSKLALFDGPLKDRLIVLSPEYKPAINIFDNTGRGTAGAIDSLMYLCSALSTEFTTLQQGLAANLARLLLVFPQTLGRNATLADLRALMVDKFPEGDYRKAVEGLRPIQQEFYRPGGFDNSEYREAKRQIRRRLDQMIGSEHLESLFYSQRNAINIAEEMQKGSIILVDCAERLMDTQDEASAFGCVFIAEVMRAIRQRNALPEDNRRACFLFVDEAATFFRGDMNYFFEGARQCHVGGTFAFHYLQQKNMAELKETMMNMTGTKLVSKRAKEDANAFAIHMGYRGDPSGFGEFLDNLPPYHFALSVAGVQETAVGISASRGELDREAPMCDNAYRRLIENNRRRVSGQQRQSEPPPPRNRSARKPNRSSGRTIRHGPRRTTKTSRTPSLNGSSLSGVKIASGKRNCASGLQS